MRVDDLEFLLDADGEGVRHSIAIIALDLSPLASNLIVIAVFLISVAAPASGLLLVAALAPLGHLVVRVDDIRGVHLTDAIVIAFLAGWILRARSDRRGPTVTAPLVGWLLSALVVASMAGTAWRLRLDTDTSWAAVVAGWRFLAGFALTAATVAIFRSRPDLAITLPAVMIASASLACALPAAIDAKATAASFALVSCLAIGMAWRAHARHRIAWALGAASLVLGFASIAIRALDAAAAFRRTGPLIESTVRILSLRPLFGVGIGQDARTSALYVTPWLSWNGGAAGTHNLLVIANELGLVGLALWLAWIGAGILVAVRALRINSRDARLWGITSGVALYVAALSVSRPLAFSETAVPFFVQFGLMIALAGSIVRNAAPPWRRGAVAVLGMCAIAAGALVSAGRGPIDRLRSGDGDGFYGWDTTSSGERFRWTEQYASLFVPADVTMVRIPVRVPPEPGRPAISLDIKTEMGIERLATINDAWTILAIAVPNARPASRVHRIDLRASRAWRPASAAPADARLVGVQIGEIQLIR